MLEDLKLFIRNPEARREETLTEVERIMNLAFPDETASHAEYTRSLFANTRNPITETTSKVKMKISRYQNNPEYNAKIILTYEENPFYSEGSMTQITIKFFKNGERKIIGTTVTPLDDEGKYILAGTVKVDLNHPGSKFFIDRKIASAMKKILRMETNASLRENPIGNYRVTQKSF